MIFGRVPVLRDENCHGLGKREKGKEKKERKKGEAEQMFCHGEMGPPRMCDVLNERYIQSVGPNLQARGYTGKGKIEP